MANHHDALLLAQAGFHIFPCNANQKTPRINDWPKQATRNPDQIEKWFKGSNHNIGISTEHFREDLALIVVDIDCKEKDGFNTLARLAEEGFNFPPTLTQTTPSGGMHFIYWARRAVKQGTSVFGENSGIDIRSRGGYIVAPGSHLPNGDYKWINANEATVVEAPAHVLEFLNKREFEAKKVKFTIVQSINQETAKTQAIEYLKNIPPVSSGSRNQEGFKVACKLKDFGCTPEDIAFLMMEHWKCEPMLDGSEIGHIVNSAFSYGKNDPGVDSPEAIFGPAKTEPPPNTPPTEPKKEHPFVELNRKFFFTVIGGHSRICEETTDEKGKFHLAKYPVQTFFDMHAGQTLRVNDSVKPLAKAWFETANKRSYERIIFHPTKTISPRFYNLFRGFSVEPKERREVSETAQLGFDLFMEHCFKNICDSDFDLNMWLLGYFAHLFQQPQEKNGVATVFKGKKGVGKNVFIEAIGRLLGDHSVVVSNPRHITGNFNSIQENKLLFIMDEAFWSGDKSAEGVIKSMITSDRKVIEAKGCEPYIVDCFDRIAILGNEDWLVPASVKERRFAVFNVGEKNQMDQDFFGKIVTGLRAGGDSLLLKFFLDFDLSEINVHTAPKTIGLAEQKEQSLGQLELWWLHCLQEGRVVGSFEKEWPQYLSCSDFENAFREARRQEGNSGFPLRGPHFGKALKTVAACLFPAKTFRIGTETARGYEFPSLAKARVEWDKYIGHDCLWDT